MSNIIIQSATPDIGKIKLGALDVSKIYNGATLVWPTGVIPPPPTPGFNIVGAKSDSPYLGYFDFTLTEQTVPGEISPLPSSVYLIQGSLNGRYLYAFPNFGGAEKVSQDFGVTWNPGSPGNRLRPFISTLGDVMGSISSGLNTNLYISRDYGATFTQSVLTISGGGVGLVFVVKASANGQHIVISGAVSSVGNPGYKVLISHNAGISFTDVTQSIYGTVYMPGASIQDAYISNDGLTIGLISSNNSLVMSKRTTNGGATWVSMPGYPQRDWDEDGVYSLDCHYIYIKSGDYFYRSVDYGVTFIQFLLPEYSPTNWITGWSMSKDGAHVLMCQQNNHYWLSSDYGANFIEIIKPLLGIQTIL